MKHADLEKPSVPIAYVELTLEQGEARGIPREALLDGTGIDASELDDPNGSVSLGDYGLLVHRLLEKTGDGGLGYDLLVAMTHIARQFVPGEMGEQPRREPLPSRVRAVLTEGGDGYPDLEAVASRLSMSSRTLKRRLREQGVSFRRLLEEVRCRDGIRLLEESRLSVENIAFQLGYHAPGNFTRAFRSWTGTTPAAFRRGPRPRIDTVPESP